MERYYKQVILSLILFLFLSIDVSAATFSSTSVRTAYWYQNGQLSDTNFVTTNPRNLPQYASVASGPVSLRLYQWRYSTGNALPIGRYKIATDITFSSLEGNSIENFLNPVFDEIRCGSTYSNASADNLKLIEYKFYKVNDTKFQFNYTIDVLSNTCSLFSGIIKYDPNEYDSKYMVNGPGTSNESLSFYTSYQELGKTDNQDIIDNANQNTQDIIDNNNQNTQDIIDSQDKINDSLTDETPPDTTGLGDAAGWLPAGPVDSLVTLPITLLQSLTNNLDSACTPINLPIPYINDTLTLDCPATLLKRFDGFWLFWEGFGLIAGCWCLYKYFINLYKWVESHLSMDDKESLGKWGGV